MNLTQDQLIAYVRATAAVLELPLEESRIQRVADHLIRTAAMARQLEGMRLEVDDEPAQVYCPAPFPASLLDKP